MAAGTGAEDLINFCIASPCLLRTLARLVLTDGVSSFIGLRVRRVNLRTIPFGNKHENSVCGCRKSCFYALVDDSMPTLLAYSKNAPMHIMPPIIKDPFWNHHQQCFEDLRSTLHIIHKMRDMILAHVIAKYLTLKSPKRSEQASNPVCEKPRTKSVNFG